MRIAASLTQEQIAIKLGIARNYVGMVERGERNPTFEVVDRWLAATGTRWSAFGLLLEETGFPAPPGRGRGRRKQT